MERVFGISLSIIHKSTIENLKINIVTTSNLNSNIIATKYVAGISETVRAFLYLIGRITIDITPNDVSHSVTGITTIL